MVVQAAVLGVKVCVRLAVALAASAMATAAVQVALLTGALAIIPLPALVSLAASAPALLLALPFLCPAAAASSRLQCIDIGRSSAHNVLMLAGVPQKPCCWSATTRPTFGLLDLANLRYHLVALS